MKFTRLDIPDCLLIEPQVFSDPRGSFYESYRHDLFQKNGISEEFIQVNQSISACGVLRGLHFQIPPREQSKLVRVVRGRAFDVAVDIRKNSKTFGRHVSILLDAAKPSWLYIPRGFAHGFLALEDDTEFQYQVSEYYSPEHERGIHWDDPQIAIVWPKIEPPYLLSEKDKKYPTLREFTA